MMTSLNRSAATSRRGLHNSAQHTPVPLASSGYFCCDLAHATCTSQHLIFLSLARAIPHVHCCLSSFVFFPQYSGSDSPRCSPACPQLSRLSWFFLHFCHSTCSPPPAWSRYTSPYTVHIGGHSLRYPWSAISDWAWYRNVRYRTEELKSDIISDIGINFCPISDIRLRSLDFLVAKW